MNKLLIMHNMIAPYRHELFDAIAEHLDTKVCYYTHKTKDRNWSTEIFGFYKSKVFKNINLYIYKKPLTISFGLRNEISKFRPNFVLTTLTKSNIFSIVSLCIYRYIYKYKLLLWIGEIEKNKIYASMHNNLFDKLTDTIFNLFYRWIINSSSGALCYSAHSSKWLDKYSPCMPRIIGGQISDSPGITIREIDTNSPCNIIYAATANERKGYTDALNVFRKISSIHQNKVNFHFIGDKEFPMINEYGLGKCSTIHSFKPRSELFNLFSEMDLLVLPSIHDPWGNVVHEAMLVGTPAVVSRGCGASMLAEPFELAYDPGDEEKLFEIINKFICEKDISQRISISNSLNGFGHKTFALRFKQFIETL